MKRTLMRWILGGTLVGIVIACSPLFAASASAEQWAKPPAAPPSWAVPSSGLHTTMRPLVFNGTMTNLTNSGRLKAEEIAWYGVWLFPGQRLDIRLSTASDFLLGLESDSDLLGISDSVRAGTESITFNCQDYATGPQFLWIGVGSYDGGSYTLRVSMTDPPVASALARIAGADRYATAVKASQDAFPEGAETVIIATGANFPDALSAAGLCGAYDAPLLLVPSASLPSVVSAEINRLGATRAIIIGGTPAVSSGVLNAIAAKPALSGNVTRIAGTNRYETAKRVAEAMSKRLGVPLTDAIVVCGTSFADALSASPLAYADHRPILLTPTAYAHATVLSTLDAIGVENVTIVGGVSVVSATAEQQIESRLGTQTQRWAGSDRFETARIVANNSVAAGALSREFIGYASGLGFPDGLSGGVASGRMGGALLLTKPWVEPSSTQAYNGASADVASAARVFGASVVVWGNVLGMINDDLDLEPAPPTPESNFSVDLDSDPGDYIGGGLSYDYTSANSVMNVTADGGHLFVYVAGWYGDFQTPNTITTLLPGEYLGVTRYLVGDPALGGMCWYGQGRSSNTLTGWFAIDNATYVEGALTAIDLRFEQHSEGVEPALHGTIHWTAED